MPYFIQKLRQPIVLASFSFVQVLHANATKFGVYGNLAPGTFGKDFPKTMPYFIQKLRQPIVLASFSFVQVLHANATKFGVYGNLAPGITKSKQALKLYCKK